MIKYSEQNVRSIPVLIGEKEVKMKDYKLENLWLCKISHITRRLDGTLILHISFGSILLAMKETDNIKHMFPEYESVDGREFVHATQKGVYTPKDIGKEFVFSRTKIPKEFLTLSEIQEKKVSEERFWELKRKLLDY